MGNMIRLSILIPSIPSRFDIAKQRYMQYMELTKGMDVEILLFMDDKKRSIGSKRASLKNLSKGRYFLMADDDDEFLSFKEIYEATFSNVDVITFNVECRNIDGSTYIVKQRLGNGIEHNTDGGRYLDCNRPPFPNCAWHRKFRKVDYPDISYGEDAIWVSRCNAETEIHIDRVLFKYNFDAETTEASTESNSFWQNPNHSEDSL